LSSLAGGGVFEPPIQMLADLHSNPEKEIARVKRRLMRMSFSHE
jgi:hypothetical protein